MLSQLLKQFKVSTQYKRKTAMYQNVPLPHKTTIRLPKIKQGLREGLNYQQIAESCGVKSAQTIDRDMKAWVESGLFEVWLKTEFVELHEHTRVANPLEAYKEIAKIVAKMVTRRTEVKQDIDIQEKQEVTFTFDDLNPDERELARKMARKLIVAKYPTRPDSIH